MAINNYFSPFHQSIFLKNKIKVYKISYAGKAQSNTDF